MIGDRASDVEAGQRAGCKSILVRTGYGHQFAQSVEAGPQPDFIAKDLQEAIELCLPDLSREHS
ncbi:MAG: HAD hydrolase-like protein [Planctomycetota bacterium]